jgi:hypothetical protein
MAYEPQSWYGKAPASRSLNTGIGNGVSVVGVDGTMILIPPSPPPGPTVTSAAVGCLGGFGGFVGGPEGGFPAVCVGTLKPPSLPTGQIVLGWLSSWFGWPTATA